MWYHFEYTTGANPYIAKTEAERDRIIRKYKRKKVAVRPVWWTDGKVTAYRIYDKEG